MQGQSDSLADALDGGTEMRSAPVPDFARSDLRHGGLHGFDGQLPDQRADAKYHADQAVLASFAREMFESAG